MDRFQMRFFYPLLPFLFMQCANRFYIEIDTITRPFTIACTERFNVLRRESLFETYMAAGFLWIQPEKPAPFVARITYHLPSFHQPGQYMCARYGASFEGLHRSRLRGCRLERFNKSEVTCICDKPGYFALLQDRPTLGRFGVQMVNKLNKPTTGLLHGFVSMCLGYCILLHFCIRWYVAFKGGLKIYSGKKLNPNREKTFLDWTIQMHLILLVRLLLQLASIKMNVMRDCEVSMCEIIVCTYNMIILSSLLQSEHSLRVQIVWSPCPKTVNS
ncbi:uncharacterized protein DEA37_0004982 [Paragonimus westermani]|uniref:Uncharacterized protein n=1 Tax=Paragonimus westermani TaxID=34504 RepID=A0A5J4NGP6_9TREM|nr:uncharacterized protein DEA37_0004982 [Paragonimus westermani]